MRYKGIVFLLIFLAVVYVSAGNGKLNMANESISVIPPARVTADVTYEIRGTNDMLLFFDIRVDYTDASGQTVVETVDQLPWSESIGTVTVPFTAIIDLTLTARESADERTGCYTFGLEPMVVYTTTDGQCNRFVNVGKVLFSKDQIEKFQKKFLERDFKRIVEIKAAEK